MKLKCARTFLFERGDEIFGVVQLLLHLLDGFVLATEILLLLCEFKDFKLFSCFEDRISLGYILFNIVQTELMKFEKIA